MKITNVRTLALISKYKEPIVDALYPVSERNCLLLLVDTDENITGVGEAACYGGPIVSTQTVIEKELKPLIIGEDPFRIERVWRKLFHSSYEHARRGLVLTAIGGIDIALWDIIGKTCKQPVYKLCGGYKEKILAYASGGYYKRGKTVNELAEEVKEYVDNGFKAIKIKVGRNFDSPLSPVDLVPSDIELVSFEEDIERVATVRKVIGKNILLMVDANNAWIPSQAIKMGKEFEKLGVYFLEEPVQTDNIEGSIQVANALQIQIAGYETEQGLFGYRDLITKHAIDIAQPDAIWVGGFTEAQKIAVLAQAYGKLCIPHNFGSAISTLINLHFAASIPNSQMLEIDCNPNPLRDELLKEPIKIDREGYLKIPNKPGFGIELNEKAVEKYLQK